MPLLSVDLLFLEEVARARAMSPADRLLEGPRLFDRAVRVMADGVRHRQPGLDDMGVDDAVRSQLARLDSLDNA